MICPSCGHENIAGSDTCEACYNPLTDAVAVQASKTVLQETVEAETLGALNPPPPVTVSPTERVGRVVRLLAERDIGCVLVVWCDALVGIFSERDVLMRIGTRLDELADHPIRHFMTPAPETLTADDSIAFALNRMSVGDFRHIPIEQDEKPVAIVSVRDMLGYLAERFPELVSQAT
jgi:CBS domain-containing protein